MHRIKVAGVVAGLVVVWAVAPKAVLADEHDPSVQQTQTGQTAPVRQISDDQWDKKPFSCKRAEQVIGAKVENASGEDLGQIKDLVINPNSGRIVYGVLTFGGFLGLGEKLFAIPWSSLERNADGDFVLNVSEDRLKNAKGFDADNWPRMADRQWAEETYSYYGERPYWDQRHSTGTGSATGNPGMASNSASSTSSTGTRETPVGAGTPAGPYDQREPGIDSTAGSAPGAQPGVRPVDTGGSDDQLATGQNTARDGDRQVAQGETGRAEFKSSVGTTERNPADLEHGLHPASTIVKASDLMGESVDNREKEALGTVKDLVIDSNNGRINSLVLARGGVLGIGEELYAIPWSKITVQTELDDDGRPSDVDDVIVNVDKEMLQSAPSFKAEAWPADDQPTYFVTVYSYYAVPQYWR